MNYASLIEEKSLKKTYIIATLCSTLVGTFTSSMGLWDKVMERRKQAKRDKTQDEEIKHLRDKLDARDPPTAKAPPPKNDAVADSLQLSGALIAQEYDRGYQRLGARFAVGDVVTENRLQAQVISLQQTVITVLQDALYHGRPLDMRRLVAASEAAREGSLEALRDQRLRQLQQEEHSQVMVAPTQQQQLVEAAPLYCRYSLDLQYSRTRPMSASFAPRGDCRCPACGVRLGVGADDFWVIGKRDVGGMVEFHLGQRFVVKCHTPEGEFACVLCTRHRDTDMLCPTVDTLVSHIGKAHHVEELEREPDFEIRSIPRAARSERASEYRSLEWR